VQAFASAAGRGACEKNIWRANCHGEARPSLIPLRRSNFI
jgi:hypothetical protein